MTEVSFTLSNKPVAFDCLKKSAGTLSLSNIFLMRNLLATRGEVFFFTIKRNQHRFIHLSSLPGLFGVAELGIAFLLF